MHARMHARMHAGMTRMARHGATRPGTALCGMVQRTRTAPEHARARASHRASSAHGIPAHASATRHSPSTVPHVIAWHGTLTGCCAARAARPHQTCPYCGAPNPVGNITGVTWAIGTKLSAGRGPEAVIEQSETVCLSAYLDGCLSVCLPVFRPVCLPICLPRSASVCLPVFLPVCLPVCPP
jgi:hypothetical protein